MNAEDVYAGDDAYQEQMLAQMQSVGVTEIRQIFRWKYTETAPGIFDWSQLDRLMLAATRHHIRILPLLAGEPDWATSRPPGNTERCLWPPRNNGDFAYWGQQVALRYGRNGELWRQHPEVAANPITAYELWNEPNKGGFWKCKPDAKAYVALARAGATAIRAVDPQATIVTGGAPKARGSQAGKYLKAAFKAGAAKIFDALALHPYEKTADKVLADIRYIRKTLDKHKAKRWTMYINEFGWATSGPPSSLTVSESKQAKLIKNTFVKLGKQRKALKIVSVDYYEWHDLPPPMDFGGGKDYWGLHTGILRLDNSAKPALNALLQASQQIK